MEMLEKLLNIQAELKCNKGQYNSFGKYRYRSCEDILEAVKPLLKKYKMMLQMSDGIENIGERYYVRSNVSLYDCEKPEKPPISVSAYAREEETKKGADGSQITGASSSYARKYALNGMFAIDDTKDSDTTNTGETEKKTTRAKETKDWRQAFINLCGEKGIDPIAYAKANGINKATTQEQYKLICQNLAR